MTSPRTALVVPAAALVLLLAGCGSAGSSLVDAAKSQAGAAVSQVTCTAVSSATDKLAGVPDADPATLDAVSGAVTSVQAGLATLGDKIPAEVKTQLQEAQSQFDSAVAQAKVDPAQGKAALTAATDKLNAALAKLSTAAGC
jgi:hypothetical protein